jgi:acyl dehydratase
MSIPEQERDTLSVVPATPEPAPRPTKLVTGKPSTVQFFPVAALGGLIPSALHQRSKTLPDVELVRENAAVDLGALARYASVCGFTLAGPLPGTYPHVLAFPLHMQLMTSLSFPVPALGLVHTNNVIRQQRPLDPGEKLTLRVHAEALREHRSGSELDLVTLVETGGETVWTERMTLFARGVTLGTPPAATAPASDAPPVVEETVPASARWRVGGDTGRRYASVSGDYNPIHLHPLTSRLFGFPRPIAHGMWTAARVLAALDGKLPAAYTFDARFRQPLHIPATVAFRLRQGAGGYAGWTATVTDARTEKLHLSAAIRIGTDPAT